MLGLYTNTRLASTGKKGILPVDDYGYRTLPVGAINCHNSAGNFYPATPDVYKLFDQSEAFIRRVQQGNLRSERDHPDVSPFVINGKVDLRKYIGRLIKINGDRECAHISSIWLTPNRDLNIPDVPQNAIIIMAKVKPSGPMGHLLEASFNNPAENTNFSIRSLTKDTWVGSKLYKELKTIITFDWVSEPGIASSSKWASPALESYGNLTFGTEDLKVVVDELEEIGLENCSLSIEELRLDNIESSSSTKPFFTKW